jgi:PKD repeat protein
MKNIPLSLLVVWLITGSSFLYGQAENRPSKRAFSPVQNRNLKNEAVKTGTGRAVLTHNHKIAVPSEAPKSTDEKQLISTSDTLHFPLEGTYALYISGQGGYVTGNNEYGDLAKADYFEANLEYQVNGILFDFAHAVGGNPPVEVAIWDNTGTGNSPGVKIATASVSLNTIKNDVTNQVMTYVPFNPPVIMTTSFYAGVVLPTATGDTLAIWSNTDGDTNPGIGWEMWSTGAWSPMSSNDSWGLNIGQAIFPVVSYDESLNAEFSASDVTIQPGQTITFQDFSTGNPTSWDWTFEGGNPATSNLQNPVVTYNNVGNYDVTLVVGNDSISDTEFKEDYISVEESSVETDTLNFPLAGTYAIYITNLNAYVSGNNEYGDLAKANFFSNEQDQYITGVLIEFAYATGANPNIEIALWNNSGAGGSPGSKLSGVNMPLNTIKNDINNQVMTYVEINPPVQIATSFYAGFMLPTTAGDTLVVWSNTDGDTNPGTAWELWNTNQWYSFSDAANSWGLNVALAIFPVVQSTLGINEQEPLNSIEFYPNPSSGTFQLKAGKVRNEVYEIIVFTTNGIEIFRQIFSLPENVTVDLSNQPAGLYIAKIKSGNHVYYERIIIH